jgi:autophagy-related protein 27
MNVEWSHASGCGFVGNDDSSGGGSGGENKGGGKEESVGSGMGWFFLV